MPRSASSASNPDSVDTPGENAWRMPSRSLGTEIAAVAVGPDADQLDAGVERPQRLQQMLAASSSGVRGAACMPSPPAKRTPAAFKVLRRINRRAWRNEFMARIVF